MRRGAVPSHCIDQREERPALLRARAALVAGTAPRRLRLDVSSHLSVDVSLVKLLRARAYVGRSRGGDKVF